MFTFTRGIYRYSRIPVAQPHEYESRIPPGELAFTRYCSYQYCIVRSIQTGGRKEIRILSNNRAILLHQGGQCRWAGGGKDGRFVHDSFKVNEYLVKANW